MQKHAEATEGWRYGYCLTNELHELAYHITGASLQLVPLNEYQGLQPDAGPQHANFVLTYRLPSHRLFCSIFKHKLQTCASLGKPRSSKQRYKLTEKGKAVLSQ